MFGNKKQKKQKEKGKTISKEELQKLLDEKFPKRQNRIKEKIKEIVKSPIEKKSEEKIEKEQQEPKSEDQPQIFTTPEVAIGKGIDKLTTKEAILMLTHIDKNDPQPMALMAEIAQDYNYDWLERYETNLLQLVCGVDAERAKMIVDVVKQPQINMGNSVTDKVKSWIKGDRY